MLDFCLSIRKCSPNDDDPIVHLNFLGSFDKLFPFDFQSELIEVLKVGATHVHAKTTTLLMIAHLLYA